MTKKIAIIGAGPTGIFTALFLKNFQGEIHLFEKNTDIGQKLKITGGGRMNVTNKKLTHNEFFSKNPRKKDHFFRTEYLKNIEDLFQELEVEYSWEKSRAILKSQDAKAEVARLKNKILEQKNCSLFLDTEIIKITPLESQKIELSIKSQNNTNNKTDTYDSVIQTTGGMFQMGEQSNTQKTYSLPTSLGHTLAKQAPSLSPFRFEKNTNPFTSLSGISLEVELFDNKSSLKDDILLTHFGLSGPGILDFSALWDKKSQIKINFLPHQTAQELKEQIKEKRNGKHKIESLFPSLPKRLTKFLIEKSNIKKYSLSELSKKEEQTLITLFTAFEIPMPQLFPYQGCWTTKGGINLDEIHIHSLESKLVANLYFGGEIIDIDGLCGGYHISLAAICAKIISDNIY